MGAHDSNLTRCLFLLKNWQISMSRGLLPRNYLLCQHVVIFEKNIKNSSTQKPQVDEAENWHTCIGHCPLQKL